MYRLHSHCFKLFGFSSVIAGKWLGLVVCWSDDRNKYCHHTLPSMCVYFVATATVNVLGTRKLFSLFLLQARSKSFVAALPNTMLPLRKWDRLALSGWQDPLVLVLHMIVILCTRDRYHSISQYHAQMMRWTNRGKIWGLFFLCLCRL
jgi:hypothetical protein